MVYLASKTSMVQFEEDMIFTEEKKTALSRALSSQDTLLRESINALREVSEYLAENLTADQLPLKAGVSKVICNLRYQQDLVAGFREELKK